MRCLLCGKELEGDIQLCSDCFRELTDKEPLWYCKGFLVGESIPDILSKDAVIALSLSTEGRAMADGKSLIEEISIPENPQFEDAERIFWKINMNMQHMGVSPYIEDAKNFEFTFEDIENLSHMLKIAEELVDFKNSAEEETLSRISAVYFYAYMNIERLKGIDLGVIKNTKKDIYSYVSRYTRLAEGIKPQKGIAELNRGFLHIQLHRYKDAVAHFKRIRDFDRKPRVLASIGTAFEGMEMYEEADEYYTKALKIDDKCIKAWMGRASVALAMKKWGAALQFVSKAITLDPKSPEAHMLEGDIFIQQGLFEEAEKAYELARKMRGGERALYKIAEGMFKAGRWGAALQFVERYLFNFPADYNGWLLKARIMREKGDNEEARKAYEKALSIKSSKEIREEMDRLV